MVELQMMDGWREEPRMEDRQTEEPQTVLTVCPPPRKPSGKAAAAIFESPPPPQPAAAVSPPRPVLLLPSQLINLIH